MLCNNLVGKKKAKEKLQLQKSFEEMTSRVCRMENTLQSLKVGMHGIQDKTRERKGQFVVDVKGQEEKYQNEIKKLEEKLDSANQEAEAFRKRDEDIQKEMEHLINDMKETQDILVERDGKIADLEGWIEKVSNQKKEVRLKLRLMMLIVIHTVHHNLNLRYCLNSNYPIISAFLSILTSLK